MTAPETLVATPDSAPRLLGVPAVPLVALILANLIPLAGVVAVGWEVRGLLLLYWAENLVVALWAVARMLVVGRLAAAPAAVFFCVHFGIFMLAHLGFILIMSAMPEASAPPGSIAAIGDAFLVDVSWWALAALVVSHGVSFFRNFLGRGEWRTATVKGEMARPYPRMLVMHVAIIIGAFFVILLGQPVMLLAVLVLLKIGLDAASHIIEHTVGRIGRRWPWATVGQAGRRR